MWLLAFGVLAFSAVHLVPAVPAVKARFAERIGPAYGPLFGAASVVTLLLVIVGWRMSSFVPVYDPPAGGRYVTFGLVLLGFLGLGIFLFRGRLRQWLRFPLALGTIAWAAGHLMANGDLASLVLFGGLFVYAAAHLLLGLAAGIRPTPDVRPGHDLLSILAGLALFGVFVQLHGTIIGVPIVTLSK
ncbi:MAG: NnrU family protein [Parvibaculaceae bacterium]